MSVKLELEEGARPGLRCDNRIDRLCGEPLVASSAAGARSLRQSGRNELRRRVASASRQSAAGRRSRDIDDCDLYAERFDPILSEQEQVRYHNIKVNREPVADYADRLLAAEALVLVYPVWNEGFSGDFEGLFRPGLHSGVELNVAADGAPVSNLQKLQKLAPVCTYGPQSRDHFP